MSRGLAMILMASLVGSAAGVAYLDLVRRQPKRLLPTALLMCLTMGVYAFAWSDTVETKGGADETIAIVLCYLAMLLGMCAEYGYTQAEKGNKRLTFEPMTFLMPIFASPIVFIPLLTITTDVALGGAFSKSKMMVYLV